MISYETKVNKLKGSSESHTEREIIHQPGIWAATYRKVLKEAGAIEDFMSRSIEKADRIILTGAGTSAYIGLSLAGEFQAKWNTPAQAISTTDLVTHPEYYLSKQESVLLVSFARSGNSPESCAAATLTDKIVKHCDHLVITCDPGGKLSTHCEVSSKFMVVLPEEANDKSLAMTSSYTGMMLAGLLISRIRNIREEERNVGNLIAYGAEILVNTLPELKKVAKLDFKRAVFLGSGPLLGTATESQLKLQELTDGHVICKVDSYLGFRHGPKAVTDPSTLMVYLFSNDPHVLQYERDLVHSMKKGRNAMYRIGIMESERISKFVEGEFDLVVKMAEPEASLDEVYLSICEVIPAQLLGLFKSIELGLDPDSPSLSGAISRVVEGVNIYPYE